MNTKNRLIIAVITAIIVGLGFMAFDKWRGAEWKVSPAQIEQAQAAGKGGVDVQPGTVAVRPIRSEIADVLFYKWLAYGAMAGVLMYLSTRKIVPKKAK
jgi:hypothetical protein